MKINLGKVNNVFIFTVYRSDPLRVRQSSRVTDNIVRAGINYRF